MDPKEDAQKHETHTEDDEISQLAYCYYEGRGCVHGAHDDDWYRAEQEVRQRRANATSPRTVIGVFQSMDDAQKAFDQLLSDGFSRNEISFIANKAGTSEWTEPARDNAADKPEPETTSANVAGDAGIGAAVGGVGGLLLSFAGLAIPGVGPVLAAGPILAALGGAGIGAAAGGLIGALVESGVPEDEAGHYAEGIRRGGILVTVKATGERANRAAEILDENGATDIDDRVSDWRNRGWTRHDTEAQPLTDDELRREREYLRAEKRQAEEWSAPRRMSRVYSRR